MQQVNPSLIQHGKRSLNRASNSFPKAQCDGKKRDDFRKQLSPLMIMAIKSQGQNHWNDFRSCSKRHPGFFWGHANDVSENLNPCFQGVNPEPCARTGCPRLFLSGTVPYYVGFLMFAPHRWTRAARSNPHRTWRGVWPASPGRISGGDSTQGLVVLSVCCFVARDLFYFDVGFVFFVLCSWGQIRTTWPHDPCLNPQVTNHHNVAGVQ